MIDADPKILQDHLQSLFLSCCSIMSAAVNTLVNGFRFKIKLEICGDSNPGYSLFTEIASRLNIEFETVKIPTDSINHMNQWLSNRGSKNLRIWILDMKYREGDFHVMLPFYLNYHLKELRKREPNFPSPKLDNLYVVSLWADCFGPRQVSLSARVLKDLLIWERAEIISIYHFGGGVSDEVRSVHNKVTSMRDLTRLYLGFCGGAEGWKLVKDTEIENHPFNKFSLNMAHATSFTAYGGGNISFPVFVRRYIWDIKQITPITKNAWALNTYTLQGSSEELEKTRKCLLLRSEGKGEDEIERELGFGDSEKYYQWQVSRMIDTDPKRFRDPLENWLEACEFFEIEPNIDLLENKAVTSDSKMKGSQDISEGSSEQTQPLLPFKHSPDFRSILATGGKSFTLTERQAHVISILHDAFENGTPELSQAFIINEVYGTVSENRLKKLFANNEVWAALIEPGSKKGLVRLKIGKSNNKN